MTIEVEIPDVWARANVLLEHLVDAFEHCLQYIQAGDNTARASTQFACVALTVSPKKQEFEGIVDRWMDA